MPSHFRQGGHFELRYVFVLPSGTAPGGVRTSRSGRSFYCWLVSLCMRGVTGRRWAGGIRIARNRNFEFFAQSKFQFVAHIFVFFQERAGVFTALTHALATKADPRT